jgi:hypothetical protein
MHGTLTARALLDGRIAITAKRLREIPEPDYRGEPRPPLPRRQPADRMWQPAQAVTEDFPKRLRRARRWAGGTLCREHLRLRAFGIGGLPLMKYRSKRSAQLPPMPVPGVGSAMAGVGVVRVIVVARLCDGRLAGAS